MKKIFKKFLLIVFILMIYIVIFESSNFVAGTTTVGTAMQVLTDPYISKPTEVKDMASRILGAAQFITILGGTVVIAAIGLKYMLGSVDEKAVTKKAWMPLIIGICIAMCATSFARIIYNVFAG